MDKQKLKEVLADHVKWLNSDGGSRADLRGAVLSDADLSRAVLSRADLRGADLSDADLSDADLRGADLSGAVLRGAEGLAFQIPQEGELIVWKAVQGGIAKLRIPPEARRTGCLINRKCRAEWVETLAVYLTADVEATRAVGRHSHSTIYEVGKPTRPDSYDDDIRVDCTHGIHFWLSREEAETW